MDREPPSPQSENLSDSHSEQHELLATCAPGIEDILERELKALGLKAESRVKGGVFFRGNHEVEWRACLGLRTASRVQRLIFEENAKTEAHVESALLSLDLSGLLRKGHGIGIELHDATKPVKKVAAFANQVERKLNAKLGSKVLMARDMHDYVRLVVHRRQGKVRVGIDLAGKALHKRGWRGEHHEAPLQETLAAALVMLSGYDGSQPFLDPFCGSGTIAIEAAYIALDKAPLVHRKKGEFTFERLADFEPRRYRAVLEEIRGRRRTSPPQPIVASDKEEKRVELAKKNAERARVGHQMRFAVEDACAPNHGLEPGILVANPPYGIRLDDPHLVRHLYRRFADTLGDAYADWKVLLLVARDETSETLIELADQQRPVKNGGIDCLVLTFGR